MAVIALVAAGCSGSGDANTASSTTLAPVVVDFTGTAAVVGGVEIPASLIKERYELARDNPTVGLALLGSGVEVEQPNGQPSPTVLNRILNQEIDNELIFAELKKRSIEPTPQEFEIAETQIRGSMGGAVDEMPEAFSTLLFTRNAQFIALDQALTPEPTDQELRAAYDRDPSKYTASCARHVLLDTVEAADEVLAELKGGADFAAVAGERSLDSESKNKGGVLDCVTRSDLGEGFESFAVALFEGPLELVQGPVQTPFGLSVVQVQSRDTASFEEAKADIAFDLLPEPMTQLGTWVALRRTKAEITVDPRFGVWQPTGGILLLPGSAAGGAEQDGLRLEPDEGE